jgi:hypothetical protein
MLAYYGPEWESLQSRMVGRWCPSFSGATGLQLPDTMGRNHGTLTNFANNGNDAYVASPDSRALSCDGTNDYVVVSNAVSTITTGVTLSIWFLNRRSFSDASCLIDTAAPNAQTQRQLSVFFLNSSSVYVAIGRTGGGSLGSSMNMQLNVLYHLVITCNIISPFAAVYLNGISRGTSTSTGIIGSTFSAVDTWIGGNVSGGGLAFNGLIDDITVFNTALTPNEVRFIYEQGRGGGMLYQPPRRRSVAAVIAALVLACEAANYSLTGQAAGLFASRLLAADQAQYILSGNAANTTASRLLSVDPASYTATGNEAATICARLLDGGAAAYALTGTDAGLIANRKLTADQAVYFLAGNNAELLRSLKLNAGSMALQLDNFAASLLADRKISADGAQYILVVSDANLGDSASGVAPYYYLFMMRGPQ